jgi:hypothetical protein
MDQPGWSGPEAAGIKVERRQVLFKVHVQPFTASRLCVLDCVADKLGSDAPPLMLTGDLGIEQEGVIASIPRHIDEADQAATRHPGRYPAKAVRPDLIPPPGRRLPAMCCNKGRHFRVGDRPAPAVLNQLGHMPDRPARPPAGSTTSGSDDKPELP